MTVFPGRISQSLDVQGSLSVSDARTLADENLAKGIQKSTGTGDSFTKVGNIVTLTDAGASWTSDDIGRFVTVSTPVTTPGNAGTFMIESVPSSTQVSYTNASGASEAYSGAWEVNDPYSLEDDLNFTRTDRKSIKGTANYYSEVPTYQRPTAVGTPVSANLTNLAGKTLDAAATVPNELQAGIQLRPPVTLTDGTVGAATEVFTTTNYHFVTGDLNSFVTISGCADATANGTYRVKTVTDGKTLVLDGLNATGGGGACTWALVSSLKGCLSSTKYADAVNRTGIPIADAGAEDETVYAATFTEMVDPEHNLRPTDNLDVVVWARTFGNQKDPKRTVTNESVRFFVQLKAGSLNDGSAPDASLEVLSGRSGSAADVTNATTTITGLSGMGVDDVGKWITLYGCGIDQAGHYRIATYLSTSSVTVTRALGNFATDPNANALRWVVSKQGNTWDFYNGRRYRDDQLPETWARTTMVGGIISDAALAQQIADLQSFVGASLGETNPVLTNTGVYFPFSNLASPSSSDLEAAVNVLNEQIGSRDYSSSILTDGQTVSASLQALSEAISDAMVIRVIERLTAAVPKNTSHVLPAGNQYVLDATNNGLNMWVVWRKQFRDPGTISNGDDYEETDTSHITPYEKINAGDHINYFFLNQDVGLYAAPGYPFSMPFGAPLSGGTGPRPE
jgi:hypothetical protein